MPCVKSNRNGREIYFSLVYYVQAETVKEAEDKAESWLAATSYDLDDSPSASPYDPAKDQREDLLGFSHGNQQIIKIMEMVSLIDEK